MPGFLILQLLLFLTTLSANCYPEYSLWKSPIRMERYFSASSGNKVLRDIIVIIVLTILIVIAYYPALQGEFTNWDDNHYVSENEQMHVFSPGYAKDCFTRFEIGNYHPLTMISLSLNFDPINPDPYPYHVTNLVLHILNTLLVLLLIRKLGFNDVVAIVTAVLFGIQATRVESVAWISARKEVLSGFFFLLTLLSYVYYYQSGKWRFYLLSVILFIFALLSKATVVVLAPLLVLTDIWIRRSPVEKRIILEKIPYFLLAIAAGIIAIVAQQGLHAIKDTSVPGIADRLVMATGNLLVYFQQLLIPYGINAFYPLPLTTQGALKTEFFLYAIIVVLLFTLVISFTRKSWKINPYLFALFFFVIAIIPVLQIIPVGEAARADRYTYLPGIGIFLLIGLGFSWLQKKIKLKWIIYVLAAPLLIASVMVTRVHAAYWTSSWSLWNSIIEQDPNVATAYCIRGQLNEARGDKEAAFRDYSAAILLNPEFTAALNNRAILYTWNNRFSDAENDLKVALHKSPDFATTYANMGFMMTRAGRYQDALNWLDKALQLNPADPFAYGNRGYCHLRTGNTGLAGEDIEHSLSIKVDNPYAWYFKARYDLLKQDTSSCCLALYNAKHYGYSNYAGGAADSLYLKVCGKYQK